MVMQLANNGMNEVIVNSGIPENYIREMYPEYKITSSTCKRITAPEKLHEELNRDYHLVVVDYDMNNKWDNMPAGFDQFKIQGRGKSKLILIEDYMYYPIKPEYRDEAYFMFMHNLGINGVVKIDNI